MKNCNKLFTISILYFLTISQPTFAVEHFTDVDTSSNLYNIFIGTVSFSGNYTTAEETDEIGVFVDNGNNGKLLVGSCNIGVDGNPNMYRVYIYSDNDTGDEIKTGAYHDDELFFQLYKPSAQPAILDLSESHFVTETTQGFTEPTFPLKFIEPQLIPVTVGYLNISQHYETLDVLAKYVSVPALNVWGQIIWMVIIISSCWRVIKKKHTKEIGISK
jgi:hypothetical protein